MNRAEKVEAPPHHLAGGAFYGEGKKTARWDSMPDIITYDKLITIEEIAHLFGAYRQTVGEQYEYVLKDIYSYLYEVSLSGQLTPYCIEKRFINGCILFPTSLCLLEHVFWDDTHREFEEIISMDIDTVFFKSDIVNRDNDILQIISRIAEVDSYAYRTVDSVEVEYVAHGIKLKTEQQLTAALQQIEELKQTLADTKAELAEAREQLAAAPQEVGSPTLTPAQRAAQAKSGKSLAAWKEVFPAMMKVYARCMEEGEKPRQGPDFYAMFNELDAELTDTQMRFFRSCLPEGHSDTDGGKCGKACPLYHCNLIENFPILYPLNIVYAPLNTVYGLLGGFYGV